MLIGWEITQPFFVPAAGITYRCEDKKHLIRGIFPIHMYNRSDDGGGVQVNDKVIELIKAQKDDGLKVLHCQYSGLMRYIVGNILQNQEDTEECINDIYIKVWHSIDSYSPQKGKFTTWLTVIARSTALYYLKRKNETCDALPEHAPASSSLEEEVLRRERAEELKKAIANLSHEEQHLFYRKYYYLQKTAQIAAELGMTEKAVEGKLYRLRKKLQQKLGGQFR